MTTIALIGYGYWGPNLLRNLMAHPDVNVTALCDTRSAARKAAAKAYPTLPTVRTASAVFTDQAVDAVIIATPVSTHFALTREALSYGKHVLVEKPLAASAVEAHALVALAQKQKKLLMVDHTYLYTPAVQTIKSIVDSRQLGTILSVECVRTNLGIVQTDTNVIADLATHDTAIIDYLFGKKAHTVSATGIVHPSIRQETVAHITAQYAGGMFAHMHVSWLSPVKIRTITIVGTKKMLVYDDMEPSEKVRVYDRGITITRSPYQAHQLRIGYRNGLVTSPVLDTTEALSGVVDAFVQACEGGTQPVSGGDQGVRVVELVSAATMSLRNGGKIIRL